MLGAVLLTTLLAACLAYFWGSSNPFRVGQTFRYEIRSRVELLLRPLHTEIVNAQIERMHIQNLGEDVQG